MAQERDTLTMPDSDSDDIRLNIGAGKTTWGDVRVDINRTDAVHALGDMHSLPFSDDTFAEVLMDNVLEHSEATTEILEEVYRILRPGGIVYIYVPYYNASGAYGDPTHRSFFSEQSFDYYLKDSKYDFYSDISFELVSKDFYYSKLLFPVPSRRVRLKLGHLIGDLVLAMRVVLRKPGGSSVEPTIDGWLST